MSRARTRRRYVQWMRWQYRIDAHAGWPSWGARGYEHRVLRAIHKLGPAQANWSPAGRVR